jgi:hypothetical protein
VSQIAKELVLKDEDNKTEIRKQSNREGEKWMKENIDKNTGIKREEEGRPM